MEHGRSRGQEEVEDQWVNPPPLRSGGNTVASAASFPQAGNFRSDEDVIDTVCIYDEDIACMATPSSTDQTMLNKQKAGTPLSSLTPFPLHSSTPGGPSSRR
ncbi:hypothetical protein FB451DRAFT_1407041 [Mycena latifolia]|nr:hypothetical protein FB451DRAFT_1407041 [Mycena latifolia]